MAQLLFTTLPLPCPNPQRHIKMKENGCTAHKGKEHYSFVSFLELCQALKIRMEKGPFRGGNNWLREAFFAFCR